MTAIYIILILLVILGILIGIKPLRKQILSAPILKLLIKLNLGPSISQTEREALEAGQIGPETDFFLGKLDKKIVDLKFPKLTLEEQNFLDKEVKTVCNLISDWQTWQEGDLAPEIWEFLKKNLFFGMIIPKEYGGLGFSHFAHSQVILKLASRSVPLAVTTMVPNSLGPAELLLKYGTQEQKDYYLPRLADGREIPCFGLTEPEAGSDASSIISQGVLFQDGHVIKIKLNWKKRWITLGQVATLIGVAFRLYDPEHLLGDKEDLGITCALIPSGLPGMNQDRRHDPLGVPFINSPMEGHDVEVRISAIIGGKDKIGKGWMMLTECLSAGRGISLPSLTTGMAKMVSSKLIAHASIRKQFGISIGHFEGVREPMVRMAANTYLMDSVRRFTLAIMDNYGTVPVISAIAKYQMTEMSRQGINDAMDIFGGTGITMGPHNYVAHAFISSPIGITVEGSNILTRTLIIFGQGIIRAHPYAYPLLKSLEQKNLDEFDHSFWSFNKHLIVSFFRTSWYTLTFGRFIPSFGLPENRRYYQKLSWSSARFASWSNIILLMYGASLKKKEYISGRFADILSWQYMALACLRSFENDGVKEKDRVYLQWIMDTAFNKIQRSYEDIASNIDIPFLGIIFKYLGRKMIVFFSMGTSPEDQLVQKIADMLMNDTHAREELREGIYLPHLADDPQAEIEAAYQEFMATKGIQEEVRSAQKSGKIPSIKNTRKIYNLARQKGILDKEALSELIHAEELRQEAIKVDSFPAHEISKYVPRDHDSKPSVH